MARPPERREISVKMGKGFRRIPVIEGAQSRTDGKPVNVDEVIKAMNSVRELGVRFGRPAQRYGR